VKQRELRKKLYSIRHASVLSKATFDEAMDSWFWHGLPVCLSLCMLYLILPTFELKVIEGFLRIFHDGLCKP